MVREPHFLPAAPPAVVCACAGQELSLTAHPRAALVFPAWGKAEEGAAAAACTDQHAAAGRRPLQRWAPECGHSRRCALSLGAPQVLEHGHVPTPMAWVTALLLVAAFLPPAPRVAGFVGGGAIAGGRACGGGMF